MRPPRLQSTRFGSCGKSRLDLPVLLLPEDASLRSIVIVASGPFAGSCVTDAAPVAARAPTPRRQIPAQGLPLDCYPVARSGLDPPGWACPRSQLARGTVRKGAEPAAPFAEYRQNGNSRTSER